MEWKMIDSNFDANEKKTEPDNHGNAESKKDTKIYATITAIGIQPVDILE